MAECACENGKTTLISACSGAANTGLLADRVARALRTDGVGSMACLAALGGGLSGYVLSARGADRNIVVDGCPVACGAKIFEKLGIACEHYVMTDFGVEKGKTAISPELTAATAKAVGEKIREAGK
jgi:uncharacterized metal-binding protein